MTESETLAERARVLLAAYYEHPLVNNPSMAADIRSEGWRSGSSGAELAFLDTIIAALSTERAATVEACARVAKLEAALKEIRGLKPKPIGDTGFQQGPALLLSIAQRTARDALKPANAIRNLQEQ